MKRPFFVEESFWGFCHDLSSCLECLCCIDFDGPEDMFADVLVMAFVPFVELTLLAFIRLVPGSCDFVVVSDEGALRAAPWDELP